MENNGESKFRKMLFNEITLLIAIGGVIISMVLFIVGPDSQMHEDISLINQRLETFETNHMAHIEKDIDDINLENKKQTEDINQIKLDLNTIITILNK